MFRDMPSLALLFAVVLWSAGSLRAADPAAEIRDQAIDLMQTAVTVSPDGRHNSALRALRHLRDPALRPLFARLAQASHPALRINGMLGLAEISPEGKLPIEQLATIDDRATLNEIIAFGMDNDLLSLDDAQKILAWQNIDEGVKVVILMRLTRDVRAANEKLLREANQSDISGRRGAAALMLADIGAPDAPQLLKAASQPNAANHELVETQMLTLQAQHSFKNTGEWAYSLIMDPNVSPQLELLGLSESMHQGVKPAQDRWYDRFRSSTDPSDRIRLALIALDVAKNQPQKIFQAMIDSGDPIITQAGRTAQAVANNAPDAAAQVVALIELGHPIANGWVLRYANEQAAPQDRQAVLLGLILTAQDGDRRGMQQRLDLAVAAAEMLAEKDPQAAAALLRPILQDPDADPMVVQAILFGIIRAQTDVGPQIVDGLQFIRNIDARNWTLLIKARSNQPMTDRELKNLGFIVQGSGNIPDTFRLQAAWSYLKRTGQANAALEQVLSRQQSAP